MSDPLEDAVSSAIASALGPSADPHMQDALSYFLYDSIKISLMLFLMVFLMGLLRTFISQERVRRALSGRRFGLGNLSASIFGAITPFCSCSSIPIFAGFLEAGVPLGVAMSFLVTSPLVNEYLAVLMLGFFGLEITAIYIASGILLGVASGLLIGRMGLEREVATDMFSSKGKAELVFASWPERFDFALYEARSVILSLAPYLVAGIAIGAIIHGYVPEELVRSAAESAGAFSVPIAVLIGVPRYANCSAVVPLALALFQKGAPLGTALAFMMASSALSFPEAVILRRLMRIRLLLVFFAMVAVGIILIGYIFNALF